MRVSILNALHFMLIRNISYSFHIPIKMQRQQTAKGSSQHQCSIKVVYVPKGENFRINFLQMITKLPTSNPGLCVSLTYTASTDPICFGGEV